MGEPAILLPGAVMPKDLAYGALVAALGDRRTLRPKDLELYAEDAPPADYGLELEIRGVLDEAQRAGTDRFHLVGYSAGGAVATAFAATHPERLLSLVLLEPAWIGNDDLSPEEARLRAEMGRLRELPPEEMLGAFVRMQLAPEAEPPPPPAGPSPPWMAKRPAGIRALTDAFDRDRLDPPRLRAFDRPVLFVLGGLSNPDYYGKMAERAGTLFPDFTLEVFPDRHHFDPPHRIEPERLAEILTAFWDRAERNAAPGA